MKKFLLKFIFVIIFLSFSYAQAEIIEFSCPITYKSLNKISKEDKSRFYKKKINFNIDTTKSTINYVTDDIDLILLTGVEDSITYKLTNEYDELELTKKRYKNIALYETKKKAYQFGGLNYVNYRYKNYVYWGGTKKKGLILMITDPDDFRKSMRDGTWYKKGAKNIFKNKGPKFLASYIVFLNCN